MTIARRARRGTVLPILGICLIGIFGFVALAVDLGMLAVSRTQCQNAADVGALVGARSLNNKTGVIDSNRPGAIQDAKDAITGTGGSTKPGNTHMSALFSAGQISNVQAGMYVYDPAATPPQFKADFAATPAAGQSWTAMRVDIATTQPTYFLRVFGVNSMPMAAYAIAVHRPRDVAFALDMTGSMGYSSQFNSSAVSTTVSLNPDILSPVFGHYVDVQSKIVATANLASGSGEAFPRNNYTISTPGGPPIARNFYFDAANISNPATPVTAIATKSVGGVLTADLLNAFHRWSPPESGGDQSNYVGVTFDFTGYNATHKGNEATPMGPTPAPDTFKTMTDAGGITYVGDRYRRRLPTGVSPVYPAATYPALNKTDTTWTGNFRAAANALELLGYGGVASSIVQKGTPQAGDVNTSPNQDQFRDPVWETYGYDLDIDKYRWWKATYNPAGVGNPALATGAGSYVAHPNGGNGSAGVVSGAGGILLPAADQFKGYSMGPGYWGKTFFMWPPDPRPANDWRLKFFRQTGGTAFDPQGDNNGGTAGTPGVNQMLLNNSANNLTLAASANFEINYPAVLAWIKSGPMVLPPNLRAGHVLYYSSIPDDVTSAGAATTAGRDQQFWKNYIDYVLGDNYTSANNLYGTGDSWASGATTIYNATLNTWTGPSAGSPWAGGNVLKPYMRYNDSPNRPRLHFWFGPLSMMDFLTVSANWIPGTAYEAHCWQLKAGMSSVLDDVQKNHPNDNVGMAMFANNFTQPRVAIGQDYVTLKNALFYPFPLLTTMAVPTPTTASVQAEYRPYNDDFSAKSATDIPNAGGSTDPNTGLMLAFNLLSPSASTATAQYGTIKGRRGASKIVIFETDGVPNTYRGVGLTTSGYNSYYTVGSSSGNLGNGNTTVINQTYPVVQQIVKPMASDTTSDSGLSLPNAPAKVYAVAFGDLFDPAIAPGATYRPTAHAFLAKVSEYGGTGPAGATTLSPDQVITGSYQNRIDTLRACMERIFQSGVSVTLIE